MMTVLSNGIPLVMCLSVFQKFIISCSNEVDTHKYVKPLAKEEVAKESYQQLVWKVCICLHGSAPQRNQRLEDELIKTFGKENIRIKRDVMLGDFLRR